MKETVKVLTAAAACLVVPAAAHAAIATFSYNTIQYAATLNGTYFSATQLGNLVILPAAGFIRFNLAVRVTGNPNAATASAYNTTTAQPANLGLNSFGQNIVPSNAAGVPVVGTGNRVANVFDVRSNGTLTGNALNGISGGVLPANIDGSDAGTFAKANIGTGTPATNIYTQQVVQIINDVVLNSTITDLAFVVNATVGDASTPPTYTARIAGTGDTVVGPGALNVTLGPEPAALSVLGVAGVGLLVRRRKV